LWSLRFIPIMVLKYAAESTTSLRELNRDWNSFALFFRIYAQTHTHTHENIHLHTHTYTNTYIHTYILCTSTHTYAQLHKRARARYTALAEGLLNFSRVFDLNRRKHGRKFS